MNTSPAAPIATPVVVEKARRTPSPRRHRLEENPPPPIRAFSVDQTEAEHPGIKDLRGWIKRADAGDPAFAWLRFAIIRIGRSVLIDDVRFRDGLHQHTAMPPAPSRRGAAGKVAVNAPLSSLGSDSLAMAAVGADAGHVLFERVAKRGESGAAVKALERGHVRAEIRTDVDRPIQPRSSIQSDANKKPSAVTEGQRHARGTSHAQPKAYRIAARRSTQTQGK